MSIKFILKTILFTLILLQFEGLRAQPSSVKDQTLLWKISGNGLKNDSYILLTTTTNCTDLNLNKKTLSVLSKVQTVTFETGLGNPDNEQKMEKLVAIKTETGSIKKIISKKLYNQLVIEAGKVGMKEVKLNTFHPIFLAGLAIKVINPCQLPNSKTTEDILRDYTSKNNIKTDELTSPEENFDIFNSYPNSYWEKTFDLLINHSSDVINELDNKTDFYLHENLRGVCALINQSDLFKLRYSYFDIESKKIELIKSRVENKIKNQSSLIQLDISDIASPATSIYDALKKSGYNISPIFN